MRRLLARGLGLLLVGAWALGTAPAAGAELRIPGETPIEDVLQIVVLEREILAVDARGGAETREALRLGETVRGRRSHGEVGLAFTDQRVLAVSAGSAAWQEARYRRGEVLVGEPLLGQRVALVVTSRRVIGFDGGSGNLVEQRLGLRERVVGRAAAANVAVVVTDRRALGVSPFTGGFFEAPLQLEEEVRAVEASGNLATVRTSRRLLTFRAPSGSWSERWLGLQR